GSARLQLRLVVQRSTLICAIIVPGTIDSDIHDSALYHTSRRSTFGYFRGYPVSFIVLPFGSPGPVPQQLVTTSPPSAKTKTSSPPNSTSKSKVSPPTPPT